MNETGRHFRLSLVLAAGVFLVSVACAGPSPGGSGGIPGPDERARVEKEIRDLETSFNGAYERNDLKNYWTFYADDLAQFYDTGRVGLDQYKKEWTALIEGGGAILEARLDELQIRVSPRGDAAGASYRLFVRQRDKQGKVTSAWYLESDTWFKRDDRWQIVQLHYSEQH
ncbi:MAG TPA: DUF4440 domain-containing protein [Candidatus Polarisedimenticolia bacterium]|nr:DUF4440 domain-containing protein [Candidatus Polarisedimenticolia bacterium]